MLKKIIMKNQLFNLLIIACLILGFNHLNAQSVQLETGFPITHNSGTKIMGQTFKSGLTTEKLKSIEFKVVKNSGNGGMVSLELYEVNGNSLQKIASTPRGGYHAVNVCRFNPMPKLKPNTTYAFVMNNGGSNFYSVEGSNKNPYKNGCAIQVKNLQSNHPSFVKDNNLDFYFKVNYDVPQNAKILGPGQMAKVGEKVFSPNRKYYAIFQSDGNFVVYNSNNRFQWGTYNNLKAPLRGKQLVMQKDGNVRINHSNGSYLWSKYHKHSEITPNSSLFINDLGEIIIITPTGKVMYLGK